MNNFLKCFTCNDTQKGCHSYKIILYKSHDEGFVGWNALTELIDSSVMFVCLETWQDFYSRARTEFCRLEVSGILESVDTGHWWNNGVTREHISSDKQLYPIKKTLAKAAMVTKDKSEFIFEILSMISCIFSHPHGKESQQSIVRTPWTECLTVLWNVKGLSLLLC